MFTQCERPINHDDPTIRNKLRNGNIIFGARQPVPGAYKMTAMQRFDLSKIKMLIVTALSVTGRSARSVSIEAGMGPDTLGKFLKGDTGSLRADNMARVLEILDIPDQLLSSPGAVESNVEGIRFGGIVEAGTFRRINIYNQDAEYQLIPLLPNPSYPVDRQFAYRVEGDSMNLEHIMPGMWIHAVEVHTWEHFHGPPNDRELVIVEAKRGGDDERRELTVKMLRIFRDRIELHPCSSNPDHQKYVIPYKPPEDHDDTVHVIAVVLSSTWLHRYKGP